MSKPLPHRSWGMSRNARDRVERAHNLISDGQDLPAELWLAYVWEQTNLPTQYVCWSSDDRYLCFADTWHSVRDVCRVGSTWHSRSNKVLERLIPLMRDDFDRSVAHNAFYGFDTPKEDMVAIIADVRRKMRGLNSALSMPVMRDIGDVPAPKRKPAHNPRLSDNTPIMPSEVQDLQMRVAQGKSDGLSSFWGEDAA